MVKIIITVLAAALMLVCSSGCSKKVMPTTMAYRSYNTECIARDPSGALTLRVWGEGRDGKRARENAAKKAVEEVLFTNITGNKANALAIIPAKTTRARQREYFNKFFKDGGQYKKFVKAEKPEKEEELNGNNRVVVPVIVTVEREKLIDKMKKDKVIE